MRRVSTKRPQASEAQIQSAIVEWLTLKRFVFTITDGERSWNRSGTVRMKRRITPGWPDISIVLPIATEDGYVSGCTFVGMEIKAHGGTVSAAQKACHVRIIEAGGRVLVVRSLEAAIEGIEHIKHPGWGIATG